MSDTPQELANRIGTQLRSIEARASTLGDETLLNRVNRLHNSLAQAFILAEPTYNLDWDQASGNTAGTNVVISPDVQAGGAPKNPPRTA